MQKIIATLTLSMLCLSSVGFSNALSNPFEVHKEIAKTAAVGTPWNAKKHQILLNQADDVRKDLQMETLKKEYPVSESTLKEIFQSKERIPFFAYSSLIDKESSAAKALSQESLSTHRPAVAFGICRVFNRAMTPDVAQNWGELKYPNDVAILNVFDKEDAVLNGVLLDLSLTDLQILCKREVGYNLIPVLVTTWDEAIDNNNTTPEIFLAYTFQAPNPEKNSAYTSMYVNPIPGYTTYLQKGLLHVSLDFQAMWWATTFLADQRTPISTMAYHFVDMEMPILFSKKI